MLPPFESTPPLVFQLMLKPLPEPLRLHDTEALPISLWVHLVWAQVRVVVVAEPRAAAGPRRVA
jgi:hypothetical protein